MRLLLSALLMICATAAQAQNHSYLAYGTSDGLIQSQVRAIAQDQRGYLWLGTLGGLSRFDGVEFQNFTKANGLPDNQINCLLQGRERFWIGSTGALVWADGDGLHTHPLPEGLENSRIFTLAETPDGKLWIGLAGEGVLIWDGADYQRYSSTAGLPDEYIRKIGIDLAGNVWVGTRSGMVIYRDGQFVPTDFEALNTASVSDVFFPPSGQMVVATFEEGVFVVDGDEIMLYRQADGLVSNNIRCIAQGATGTIWLGASAGISLLHLSEKTLSAFDKALPYSNIKCLDTDREMHVWIGTDGQGLLRRAGRAFTSFGSADGLCSDVVMQIAQSPDGTPYFGTYDQGICMRRGGAFQVYEYNEKLPSKTIWKLRLPADGSIWAGTSQGLYHEKDGRIATLTQLDGLPGSRVTALSVSDDLVIAGAERGFAFIDPTSTELKITKVFDEASGFNGKRIRAIKKTSADSIWIGAEGKVFLYTKGQFSVFHMPDEVPVYSLETDALGHLWIGTSAGLYWLSKRSEAPQLILLSHNYSARHTNFIAKLSDGSILVGTNNGVYRVNPLLLAKEGKVKAKHFAAYEGLKSTETNQNAVYASGPYVWFGTTSGAVRFEYGRDSFSKERAPKINLTSVELFLQSVDWSAKADSVSPYTGLPVDPILSHDQNYLTFNYAGIYLANPDKVRYYYKLEGADEDWLGPTRSRSATYAYLKHGTYTFMVKAFSENDPELIDEASFSFTITPPFYLTWWFFMLTGIFVITVFYLIFQSRVRKERERRETMQLRYQSRLMELESQTLNSSMNRHFIFNALNSIQYYINVQDRRSANKYLTSFAKLIRKNLDSSQHNETSLREELDRLELYLSLEQMRFQGRFDYEIEIAHDVDPEEIQIPAMMLQPFLENSIWHGILPEERHGMIQMNISSEGDCYIIQIDDNGIGIKESMGRKKHNTETHNSQGMSITQNRIALYKRMTGLDYEVSGPADITDIEGITVGTRVIIKIPKAARIEKEKKSLLVHSEN